MGTLRLAPGPRARILAVAAFLFAAIFAARLVVSDPTAGLALLYVLPVVLVAIELGAVAGALAGVFAVALFALWVALTGADVMNRRLRSGDAVARLGGDEFAVILRRVDHAEARRVADELVELAKSSLSDVLPGRETVTLSVGVVSFGESDPPGGDALLAGAYRAMYDAKRAGGGRAVAPAEPVGAFSPAGRRG